MNCRCIARSSRSQHCSHMFRLASDPPRCGGLGKAWCAAQGKCVPLTGARAFGPFYASTRVARVRWNSIVRPSCLPRDGACAACARTRSGRSLQGATAHDIGTAILIRARTLVVLLLPNRLAALDYISGAPTRSSPFRARASSHSARIFGVPRRQTVTSSHLLSPPAPTTYRLHGAPCLKDPHVTRQTPLACAGAANVR